ncbi:MAG: FtsX-like permease family protein [Treponema sp.]|nr:FtsX-like permease family protein [Treponema sp.]
MKLITFLYSIWDLKKIALRNLARHKTKTILTSVAIMVSVAVYIFLNSWLGGMAIESRRNIVNFEMGAAKVQTHMYFERFDEMPSYETFMDWEIYHEALSREGYASAPRFIFSGTMFSANASAPILFHGIDPVLEPEVMGYVSYVDFGRWVEDHRFEVVLGTLAAERLRVGIPTRPYRRELEELISQAARNPVDAEFIRSLYEVAPTFVDFFSPDLTHIEGNERMILGRNVSREHLDRYWDLIAATDRNYVQIGVLIETKAAPQLINRTRWEVDLMPALSVQDRALVSAAYNYLEFLDAYDLIETDPQRLDQILSAMIRADYVGAVRRENQLISAVVVGVINSPAPLPNGNTAYIPLSVLQDRMGMMLEGAVSELVVRERGVSDSQLPGASESSPAITAALERGLSSMGRSLPDYLGVFTWDQYMEDYLGYEAIQTGAPQVLAFLLFILSFLGISNTILMAILERTKETGMMRALGMTDRQMIMTYMLEAGFLGFIGSILGIILGSLINYPMVKTGIDFSAMADTLSGGIGFRTTGVFRSVWNIPLMIGSGIVATLIASCMAFFPTRKAVKMPITDSLRFE